MLEYNEYINNVPGLHVQLDGHFLCSLIPGTACLSSTTLESMMMMMTSLVMNTAPLTRTKLRNNSLLLLHWVETSARSRMSSWEMPHCHLYQFGLYSSEHMCVSACVCVCVCVCVQCVWATDADALCSHTDVSFAFVSLIEQTEMKRKWFV